MPKIIIVENQNLLFDGLVAQLGHLDLQVARGLKVCAFRWEQDLME